MKDFKGKKILMILPHSTVSDTSIKATLENAGAIVDSYDERPDSTVLTKIILKLNRDLIAWKINKYHCKIIQKTKNIDYDIIFFMKCESFSKKNLLILKNDHPNANMVLYLADSFKNNPNSLHKIDVFDSVYSFDRIDCEQYGINFRPLFYYDFYTKITPKKKYKYKTLFIGTLHSDRFKIVNEVNFSLREMGYNNFYTWFFLSTKFLLLKLKLKDKTIKNIDRDTIKYKLLSLDEIIQLYEISEIVIDVQHPNQTGLTMRTIETLGARRKLITTNKDIVNYDFYNSQNILVLDRNDISVPKDFLERSFQSIPEDIYIRYSLSYWLKEILLNIK